MTVEGELYSRLSTFPGLTALVAQRIYPNMAPQGVVAPFVTFRRVSAARESGMGTDIGIVEARFQVDVFAVVYLGARQVADQVRRALQRWRKPTGNPEILDSYIENETDLYEEEAEVHHAVVDAVIWFRE